MNPLRLFDYVFYCIAMLYDRVFDYKLSCEEAAVAFVSMFQWLNILTLMSILNLMDWMFRKYNMVYFIGSLLIIIGLNFLRYKKVIRYVDLARKWDNEEYRIRIIKIGSVIVYGLSSIILMGIL